MATDPVVRKKEGAGPVVLAARPRAWARTGFGVGPGRGAPTAAGE